MVKIFEANTTTSATLFLGRITFTLTRIGPPGLTTTHKTLPYHRADVRNFRLEVFIALVPPCPLLTKWRMGKQPC